MADKPDIFAKHRLTVGQLRAVADRRFGDAEALVATGENARGNGAQYLAGLVIEILLKGALLKLHPNIATALRDDLSASEREIWTLVWRSHDLASMLDRLPMLRAAVGLAGRHAGMPYEAWLLSICNTWTIHARYSPAMSTIKNAQAMLDRVRILKEVLR